MGVARIGARPILAGWLPGGVGLCGGCIGLALLTASPNRSM